MFSRVSYLSFSCLRCQKRLANQGRLWKTRETTALVSSSCRYQSAVAQQPKHDPQLTPSQTPDVREPDGESQKDVEDSRRDGGPAKSQHRLRNATAYRRWKPTQAEDLGLNVLGKRAEVIILPTREPKTTKSALEHREDGNKESLQTALDAELEPVTMTDVLRNIGLLKVDLGKGRDHFSEAQWEEYSKRLADGFTRTQLQEYLRLAAGKSSSEAVQTYMKSKGTQKREIAAEIMSEVWKWRSGEEELGTVSELPSEQIKKNIKVNTAKLDYIMLYEKQQLGRISESLAVQIDVFKKKSRIQLVGSDGDSVEKANSRVNDLVKSIHRSTLRIPWYLKERLIDNAKLDALATTIMQRHKIVIRRDQDFWVSVGLGEIGTDMVLRDLILLSGKLRRGTQFTFCMVEEQDAQAQAPAFPSDLPQWLQSDQPWHRHVSTKARFDADDLTRVDQARDFKRLVGSLLKLEKPNQKRLSQFFVAPNSLNHDYFADLGHALFHSDASPTDSIDQKEHYREKSIAENVLVLQQAFLPQILARQDFSPVGVSNGIIADRSQYPMLLHLRLRPVIHASHCPPIELLLTGRDAGLGLRQPLEIKKVWAILDEWQHVILLPHQPLDIVMNRQSKVNLLSSKDGETPAAYLSILGQLGSYLEEALSKNSVQLPPIWRLDVSSLLSNRATLPQVKTKSVLSDADTGADGSSDDEMTAKAAPPSRATSTYVLEPPEFLDVTSHTSTLAYDGYIDYITCDTDPLDRPRQRQILRFTNNSLSTLLGSEANKVRPDATNMIEKQRRFRKCLSAAHEFVTLFRDAERKMGKPPPRN